EGSPEGRTRLSTDDIGHKVRILLQHTRSLQPAQHRHHQKITRAEGAIEPVAMAKATGKVAQPFPDSVVEDTQTLLVPGLVALEDLREIALEDRWFHGVERGKHPCDRACPGIRIVRQQARM